MAESSFFGNHGNNRTWLIVLSCLLVFVAAGFVYAVDQHVGRAPAKTVPNAVASMTPDAYTARITHPDVVYKLVVADNKTLASGPSQIIVKLGQSVNVNIYATGTEATVNLKGYNINTEAGVEKGAEGGFHFIADTAGSFPFYALSDDENGAQAVNSHQLGTIVVE